MIKYIFICLFLSLFIFLDAQEKLIVVPILEREISISAENQSIETILNSISKQAGFVFSYSPEAIEPYTKVSINARDKSVRYVLGTIFQDKVEYKVKGKYVILKKNPAKSNSNETSRIFEGYVYDSKTGKKLTEASIYNESLLASAVTDNYGYFSMKLPTNTPLSSLQISKVGYSDTLLVSLGQNEGIKSLEIRLQQRDSANHQTKSVFLFEKERLQWLVPKNVKINSRNITQPVFRLIQFSLFPRLSTNHFLGGVAVNQVSINATAGYVKGVRIAEFGGILNMVQNDVRFMQAGGIGNYVGGDVTGFQAAGIFNITHTVKGAQAAGIFNQVHSAKGAQMAGIYNYSSDTAFIQFAGIMNLATKNNAQISGLINRSKKSALQISGFMNLTEKSNTQVAGFLNHSKQKNLFQIAGFLNTAKEAGALQLAGGINTTSGSVNFQVAGLLNKARVVKGMQLALFNFSDSCTGIPLGLISFVKYGYHKLEFSADETFPINIAFRTGVTRFHTMLTAGALPAQNGDKVWNLGYGLGTSLGNWPKTLVDIDFTNHEVFINQNFSATNHLYRLYSGIDRKISPKISLAFGVTLNVLLSDTYNTNYPEINAHIPAYTLWEKTYPNGHNLKSWIGGKVALRFF